MIVDFPLTDKPSQLSPQQVAREAPYAFDEHAYGVRMFAQRTWVKNVCEGHQIDPYELVEQNHRAGIPSPRKIEIAEIVKRDQKIADICDRFQEIIKKEGDYIHWYAETQLGINDTRYPNAHPVLNALYDSLEIGSHTQRELRHSLQHEAMCTIGREGASCHSL